jgi:hypothetical protein
MLKLCSPIRILGPGLLFFSLLPCPSAARQSDLVQLRVSVFNSSPFLASIIEAAEARAGRVLRYAGIEVLWLNCSQAVQQEASHDLCSEISFPSHLSLRIVRASQGLKATTVGISFSAEDGKGCYADLFYESIRQLHEETDASPSVILGHAMAHELGHLLLGTNSHSQNGLMRAHWTREDLANASRGNLRLSPEESVRITNRLAQVASRDLQTLVMAAK